MRKQEYQPFLSGFVPEFVYNSFDLSKTASPSELGSTTAISVLKQLDAQVPLCVEQIAQLFRIMKITYHVNMLPGRLGSLVPLPGNNGLYFQAKISRNLYAPDLANETFTLAHEIGHVALWDARYQLKDEHAEEFCDGFAEGVIEYSKGNT